jgi:hypothetical protein
VKLCMSVLHRDLDRWTIEEAIHAMAGFIKKNETEVLNVVGSRGSTDAAFYDKILKIVYCVFVMTRSLRAYVALAGLGLLRDR